MSAMLWRLMDACLYGPGGCVMCGDEDEFSPDIEAFEVTGEPATPTRWLPTLSSSGSCGRWEEISSSATTPDASARSTSSASAASSTPCSGWPERPATRRSAPGFPPSMPRLFRLYGMSWLGGGLQED